LITFGSAFAVIALIVIVGAFAGGEQDDTTAASVPTTTAGLPPTAAPYELREDGRDLTMLVTTDNTDELGAAFRALADTVVDSYPDGGYFVQIDCALEGQSTRLGNGKIAVGSLGAAQTGLSAGQRDIDWLTGQNCQPGHTETTFDPDRPLDHAYALELCRGKVESEYVAQQRPVDLLEVETTESAGKWTVAGTARGRSTSASAASVAFTCTAHVNSAGLLMVDLTQFDVQ
jgi:hypothetical protein